MAAQECELVKLLSILAALYLSAAPGMNLARLVHSVDICHLFESPHSHSAPACPHDHAPEQPQQPQHTHDFHIESGAIPVAAQAAPSVPAAPYLLHAVVPAATGPPRVPCATQPEHPPPIPRAGITLLLI